MFGFPDPLLGEAWRQWLNVSAPHASLFSLTKRKHDHLEFLCQI